MDLGNCPKRENLQKWLGEGAEGLLTLLGPGSKGLPRVFCTTQTPFCTGATPFRTNARGLLLAGSKRPFAPSPNHFRELSLFGKISQVRSFPTLDLGYLGIFEKGPHIPGFGKIILLQIPGFRFGNLEGSARYHR